MAAYQVTGPLVIAKKEDGGDLHLYEGAIVGGQSDDWVKRHLALGLICKSDAPEPVEPEGDGKPAGNASLEAWQDYAKTQGHTDDDLDGLSRDDIRALFA